MHPGPLFTVYVRIRHEWSNFLPGKHLGVDPDHWPLGEQNLTLSPLILCCGIHLYTALNKPLASRIMLTVPHSGLVSFGH